MKFAEKEICRIQSVRSFKNERYGNALEWALRSQDNVYVTAYADHFLRVSYQLGKTLSRISISTHSSLALRRDWWDFVPWCRSECRSKDVCITSIGVPDEVFRFPKLLSTKAVSSSSWTLGQSVGFEDRSGIVSVTRQCSHSNKIHQRHPFSVFGHQCLPIRCQCSKPLIRYSHRKRRTR